MITSPAAEVTNIGKANVEIDGQLWFARDRQVFEFFIGFHSDAFPTGGFELVAHGATWIGFSFPEFLTEFANGLSVPYFFQALVVDVSKRDIGNAAGFGDAVVGDVEVDEGT